MGALDMVYGVEASTSATQPDGALSEVEQQVLYYAKHKTGGFDPQATIRLQHARPTNLAAGETTLFDALEQARAVRRLLSSVRGADPEDLNPPERTGGGTIDLAELEARVMRAENAAERRQQFAQGAGGADGDHHHRRSAAHRAHARWARSASDLACRSWRPGKARRRSRPWACRPRRCSRPAARGWSRSPRCASCRRRRTSAARREPAHRRACATCSARISWCCRASPAMPPAPPSSPPRWRRASRPRAAIRWRRTAGLPNMPACATRWAA